jgi:hypothetical protein
LVTEKGWPEEVPFSKVQRDPTATLDVRFRGENEEGRDCEVEASLRRLRVIPLSVAVACQASQSEGRGFESQSCQIVLPSADE